METQTHHDNKVGLNFLVLRKKGKVTGGTEVLDKTSETIVNRRDSGVWMVLSSSNFTPYLKS